MSVFGVILVRALVLGWEPTTIAGAQGENISKVAGAFKLKKYICFISINAEAKFLGFNQELGEPLRFF